MEIMRKFITCKGCAVRFKRKCKTQLFCMPECRIKYNQPNKTSQGLSNGVVGAISELMVASDLLVKGFEVFRSVSPACSCDIVALKEGKLKRIKVRTAYRNSVSNKLYFCKNETDTLCDHYAAVIQETGEIVYVPELD